MDPQQLQQFLAELQRNPAALSAVQQALQGHTGAVSLSGNNAGNINTGLQIIIEAAKAAGASVDALRQGYLAQVLSKCNVDVLLGGDDADHQLKLHQLYTPLWTDWRPPMPPDKDAREQAPPLSALEMLNHHPRCVLLGGPGSGKSSLAHMLVAAMAAEELGQATPQLGLSVLRQGLPTDDGEQEDDTEEPTPQAWAHGPLLPVWLVLRDLAVSPRPTGVADARWVWQHLQSKLTGWGLEAYFAPLQTHLQEHGSLIVLDGLDEVTDAAQHREHLRQAVQCFADALPRCRVLVTSRPYAYQHKAWQLEGFEVARLAPLNRAQIAHFARAWYRLKAQAQALSPAEAQACKERLLAEVDRNPRFAKLAAEPLLLTLIAQVQTASKGELPKQRFELYERTVSLLLNQWERTKRVENPDGSVVQQPSLSEFLRVGPEHLRANIEALAFEVHRDQQLPPPVDDTEWTAEAPDTDEATEPPCADISGSALREALCRGLAHDRDIKPHQLEDYLRHRAGLLAQHDEEGHIYRFPHRSFQEFLAACHACDLPQAPHELVQLACDDPGRWSEVVLLAAAKLELGSANGPWSLADQLCPTWPPSAETAASLNGASLAGLVMLDRIAPGQQPQLSTHQAAKRERFIQAQLQVLSHPRLPATTRATAGLALAHMGDPRTEVMMLDGMRFAHIPAGDFIMGDEGLLESSPAHRHTITDDYFIAEYPVTLAQWRAYVEASGQQPKARHSLTGKPNQPVTYVSWSEAQKMADWLNRRWAPWLPTNYRVALPSEAEWEMAARGGTVIPSKPHLHPISRLPSSADQGTWTMNPIPDRRYPWGHHWDSNRANAEQTLSDLASVGCFCSGVSPYGLQDMVGQVLEWTRSLTEFSYPYSHLLAEREVEVEDENDWQWRSMRGGSFMSDRDDARCSSRSGDYSHFRDPELDLDLGFRLAIVHADK